MLPQEPAIQHDFPAEPLGGHQPAADQADQPARDTLAKTRQPVAVGLAESLDQQITADLKANHHYCVIQVVPYGMEIPPIGVGDYVIWRYDPNLRFPRPVPHNWNCG